MRKNKLHIVGAIVGGFAGYLYYYFIGCASGTCLITSKPINSTLYFAMMGALVLGMFKKPTPKTTKA
jgi:phage shock protein E